MTFNWKMKQNHRMTVTMFSPDSFKMSLKPQKTVTTTQTQSTTPKIVITEEDKPHNNQISMAEMQDNWEFHSENPRRVTKNGTQPPPLEKMISAPGNLQQFITKASEKQQSIKQFQPNASGAATGQFQNRRRRNRTSSNNIPPSLQTQISTPSMVSLVSPINRSKQRTAKTQRPFLRNTKKLASTSDLKATKVIDNNYKPPPLISRNSESSLMNSRTLPSLNAMVSGSPADSPNSSPYNSCNESDQEMRDVERQTSKMSIQHLLVPGSQ